MRCLLGCLALTGCFSGDVTLGLPCTGDDACGGGLACVDSVCGGPPDPVHLKGLGVLFVVTDDPGSGELQARVAAAADPFLKVLQDAGLDFRVGVISTAMDHPACLRGDDGALLLTSCRDRLDDFKYGDLDATTEACELRCNDAVQGDAAVPVATTAGDSPARVRPWIQYGDAFRSNLFVDDLAPNRMIGCFLPRGISGCRFEQPLASLLRALERMRDPLDDNYGFVPDGGLLVVLFVGRGPECSHPVDAATIFDPAGARAFWNPDLADDPAPSICWNAGAACSNAQDGRYYECHPVDRAADGTPAAPADAVLLPVDATAEAVTRAVSDLGAQLVVGGVFGVPPDFAGELLFPLPGPPPADMPDPFGIGPGCVDADKLVVAPPLRLYALAEAINVGGPVPTVPACIPDHGDAMTRLARDLVMRMNMPQAPP